MNLAVLMNSRGRADLMKASVLALQELASGKHKITYGIRCDDDDEETWDETLWIEGSAVIRGERLPTLGEGLNSLAEELAPRDAYAIWHSASFPLTVDWDDNIAQGLAQYPEHVLWWQTPGGGAPTLPAFGRRWYEARGAVFTEIFPFWFDDTWIAELSRFIYGDLYVLPCFFSQRRSGKTTRLRDLDFWYRLFFALRPQRVEEARRMCDSFHRPFRDPSDLLAAMRRDDEDILRRVSAIEAHYGAGWEGDAQYFATKAKAEIMMKEALHGTVLPLVL